MQQEILSAFETDRRRIALIMGLSPFMEVIKITDLIVCYKRPQKSFSTLHFQDILRVMSTVQQPNKIHVSVKSDLQSEYNVLVSTVVHSVFFFKLFYL